MYLLQEAHVATVAGSAFCAPGYIRMSYATSDDNIREAMERIKAHLLFSYKQIVCKYKSRSCNQHIHYLTENKFITMSESTSVVIIPTYNECENAAAIIEAVLSLATPMDVLVVDDGSPDGTAAIVKSKQTEHRDAFT